MLVIDKDKNQVEILGDMDILTVDLYNLFRALCSYGMTEQEIIRCVAMAYVMAEKEAHDDPSE